MLLDLKLRSSDKFSIESFLYECLVISLLSEADKITKADTQNKSVAEAVAIDQSNKKENVVDVS